MLVGMRATRTPSTPDANSITWRYHLAHEVYTFVHGQPICDWEGALRVSDHATQITRIAPAMFKRVATSVPPNLFMYQPTARSVAKHNYTWDVTNAIVWVAILLHRLVTVNVRRGQTYRTFALLFERAAVVARIVDICATIRMQIHVARITTEVLASLHGKRIHRSSWTLNLARVAQSHT